MSFVFFCCFAGGDVVFCSVAGGDGCFSVIAGSTRVESSTSSVTAGRTDGSGAVLFGSWELSREAMRPLRRVGAEAGLARLGAIMNCFC